MRSSSVLWRRTSRAILALRPEPEADVVELGGSSGALWDALEQPMTVAELAASLVGLFDADAETIARDLGPVLAELADRGLVEEVA